MAALKWGIVTAGRISNDFLNGLRTLPSHEHTVVCIGARNLKSAQDFAKLHNIPIAYEGYESIAKNPDVEIAYIGALHPAHYEIGVLMLEHGKHVLSEKPLCMNAKQTKKLTELARSKNLFLMEGIWSRFFPVYQHVKEQIDAGKLGEIREVNVTFGFNHKQSARTE